MTYQAQAADATEPVSDTSWEIVANQHLYGVISGCGVTASASDMTVDDAAGSILHNGSVVTVAGGTDSWTLVADASNPRFSWLAYDSDGSPAIVSGDATADPVVPEIGDRTANQLVLIPAGETLASNCTFIDKRIPTPVPALPAAWLPDYPLAAAAAQSALAAGTAYLVPMRPLARAATITEIMVTLGGSTDNIDVGIYSTTDWSTFTRVVSTGSTAFPGTGSQHLDITDTELTPGTIYCAAVVFAGTTATISAVSGSTMPTGVDGSAAGFALKKVTSLPLPSSITTPVTENAVNPLIAGVFSGGRSWTT